MKTKLQKSEQYSCDIELKIAIVKSSIKLTQIHFSDSAKKDTELYKTAKIAYKRDTEELLELKKEYPEFFV